MRLPLPHTAPLPAPSLGETPPQTGTESGRQIRGIGGTPPAKALTFGSSGAWSGAVSSGHGGGSSAMAAAYSARSVTAAA